MTHTQDRLVSTAGAMGGLVQQHERQATRAMDLAFATGRAHLCQGGIERFTPALSCYRTVSQRSLSVPTTFLSALITDFWMPSPAFWHCLLEQMLTDAANGAITPPAGEDTLRFNDNDRQQDRARLEDKVLIGIRASVSPRFTWGMGLGGPPAFVPANLGPMTETLENYINSFVTLGVFHTQDDEIVTGIVSGLPNPRAAEPWIDFTPLGYFNRPDDSFVAVPPLLWPRFNRDPNMQIGMRAADFGNIPGGQNPDWNNALLPFVNTDVAGPLFYNISNLTIQLSILIEALFVPSPEACGANWPGHLCPTHKIGLHPDYTPDVPRVVAPFTPAADSPCDRSLAAGQECEGCGCDHKPIGPRPPGILDPRFNMRETVKQMLLLEDHLFHKDKVCNDCIHKHCLKIEALGEEGVTLDRTDEKLAGRVCSKIASFARMLERRLQAGEDKPAIADDVRNFRKTLAASLRMMAKDDGRD